MRKRTFSIIGVMTLAMLCIACFAHAGVSDGFIAKTVEVTQAGGEEITEDIYVDITAHQMFYNALFNRQVEEGKMDPQEMSNEMIKKMDEVYKAHGVTEEAYTAYHEELTEDMDAYLAIMGPINKRVGELVEKYQPE